MTVYFFISGILSWFVDKSVVEKALRDHSLIEEDEVECRPERVSDAILDENVDICLVRNHFSEDAWMIVGVLKRKSDMVWLCRTCLHDLHSEESITCDSCLNWHHFKCVGLTKLPKSKNWFCRACYASSKC